MAFQRWVSLEPKQELNRRRSARLPGCPTAVRHFITGQCPLTRDPGRIIRTAEEVCPFLGPYGSARRRGLPHGPDRAQTPRPGCPEPRRGGGAEGCDTLHLQPSWAFKGKKSLKPGFANSSKPAPVLGCFPTSGDHTKAPLRDPPDPPEFSQLTTLHAGA